jgi:hypothetical protein
MAFDEAAVQNLFDLIQSKVLATAYFQAVNTSEPKASPGNDIICAIWIQSIGPARGQSGLSATSGLVIFNVRIYSNMFQEPQDAIDPSVLKATTTLLGIFSEDFELIDPQTEEPTVREVDLLGAVSSGLGAQAGYLSIGGQLQRVMTISLPVIINDCWTQSP